MVPCAESSGRPGRECGLPEGQLGAPTGLDNATLLSGRLGEGGELRRLAHTHASVTKPVVTCAQDPAPSCPPHPECALPRAHHDLTKWPGSCSYPQFLCGWSTINKERQMKNKKLAGCRFSCILYLFAPLNLRDLPKRGKMRWEGV